MLAWDYTYGPVSVYVCVIVSLSQVGVLTKRLDGQSDATDSLLLMTISSLVAWPCSANFSCL